jgi:excinuclease ABC subunit C
LVLIDGGKGQLDAAQQARDESEYPNIPFIGLSKRDEQIVIKGIKVNSDKLTKLKGFVEITKGFILINLPKSSAVIKFLQRIRDESHRFSVSYHTTLKRTKQTTSGLDGIPGIGPKTRSKLIRKFGSVRNLKTTDESEIALTIGPSKAKLVLSFLSSYNPN